MEEKPKFKNLADDPEHAMNFVAGSVGLKIHLLNKDLESARAAIADMAETIQDMMRYEGDLVEERARHTLTKHAAEIEKAIDPKHG